MGAAALLGSVLLTGLLKRVAVAKGFVDRPGGHKSHTEPVALGGGIAIFWVVMAPLLLAATVGLAGKLGWDGSGLPEKLRAHLPGLVSRLRPLLALIGAVVAMHVLGLVDDQRHLGPKVKLVVQLAAAVLLATVGEIRFGFFIHNEIVTTILSVLWIGVIINAFNFLDNMDGLSAGVAFICCGNLLVPGLTGGQFFVGVMVAALMGALLGFLFYNFAPARIYMGDAGSLVVGTLVAVVTIRTTYYYEGAASGAWFSALTPLVVLAVPLYDFTSVTIIRLLQGKSPFVGDQQHFSHRLVRRGMTTRQAVLTIYLATACTGLGALSLRYLPAAGAVMVCVQTLLILLIVAILEGTKSPNGER
ncbi:MAG: undecaprenyl/decaprenyl-phosphate alpha-N-acetylglucosaminyl 1-phosphate transferase [Sedimentisphaerales bacterium]|nr:undecaprenyl/decaprenyl-phosphate alpha-N-acetylglucosaminyl 1-phosphate transferase [Sedimentisphaerales bacterium]